MLKVWMVTSGEFSNYCVHGVFSSPEKAKDFVDLARISDRPVDVEECVVDAPLEMRWLAIHSIHMRISDGAIVDSWELSQDLVHPRFSKVWKWNEDTIAAQSAVSADHAVKVAAEERQRLLRLAQ